MTEEAYELPRLSLAERDRRHGLVREAMDRAGLDVVILPANSAAGNR